MRICREQLEAVYAREEKLGRFTAALTEKIRDRIHLTVDLSSLRECELVVEAVFEKMQLKMELFSKLDKICPAGTIFATNTSSLDINKMASVLENPSRLVGIHFFNPAHVIRTVEIVYGRHTSAESIATAFSVSSAMKKVGICLQTLPLEHFHYNVLWMKEAQCYSLMIFYFIKVAVLVGNCPSFVFNRLLGVYLNQAEKLLYQYGMLPKDVDALITAFGFPIGPFTMADLNGLDVLAFLKSEHNYPLTALEKELLSRNRLGRKTGKMAAYS
ncbi:unnamed protein product [Nippostrongylus brasiliensis]|uniref:3-hydroxyacyl-CoA dehydrogenase family protein n=1 Tax=Nippostrongylus brasiliensis TaxID=27835 RepID=A0A0N4YG06_NIPBR|nr:unnamed protein product [Nippostrongylus brasiliensis]